MTEKKEEYFLTKWVFWLVHNRFYFFVILLCLMLTAAFIYRNFFWKRENQPISIVAENNYLAWIKEPEDSEKFQILTSFLKKNTSLKEKYEGLIVQKLMDENRCDQIIPLAISSIKRVEKEIPYYLKFSKTTLFLHQKEYKKALQEAQLLREEMKGEVGLTHSLLYYYNLLRIATLARVLQDYREEYAGWKELEENLQSTSRKGINKLFLENFPTTNNITFLDFISFRTGYLKAQLN